ncbi:MAG TPA: hypothetical protein VK447_12300 [Myxococcaceae bacterium]|nr:hypothetical protein [Myxococcaceae bacterium]
MSDAAGPAGSSPILRLLHLFAVAGFSLITALLISPELAQLQAAQRAPYHFGDPPRAVALIAGALLVVALVVLLWRVARRKPSPLWASGLVLLTAVLAVANAAFGEVPRGRTWAAADVKILAVARELQQRMLVRLEVEGQLPEHEDVWRTALAEVAPEPSPARTRTFEPVPYRLVLEQAQGRLPEGLAPGTLVVWRDPRGDAFELIPVGFARDGTVGAMTDERGERVVLRGGAAPAGGAGRGAGQ